MTEQGRTEQSPPPANWVTNSSLVIIGGLIGGALATGFDIADKAGKLTDRLGWTKSDALVLARESEKSKFSDALTRSAYRRLILADIFARRVQDGAPSSQIEEAWKSYVAALIEWNSELMINIVGLDIFYDAQKSLEFETIIQEMFRQLDDAVRLIYLSPALRELRSHPDKPINVVDLHDAPTDVFKKTENIRLALYVFVRCFKKGESKEKKNPACDIRNLAGVDLVLPPLPAERYPFGDKQELLRLEREYITPTPPTPEQSPARPR